MLPNTEKTILISADATDFEMDAISINGVRLSLDIDVDDSELTEQTDKIVDAGEQLDDGAQELLDGASELRIWAQIMVPIAAPGMASLAMVVLLWNWNNYLDPLVFLTNWRLYTIPIALTNFIEESVTEYNLVMAASASALLPVFIVFLAGQKFFVKGLMAGAVKG